MKKFIYRLSALLMLLTEELDIWLDANEEGGSGDEHYSYFNLDDVLNFIQDYHISTWWEVIGSPHIDPYTSPWHGNEHNPYHKANRDLGYPVITESVHHRRWRLAMIDINGKVRD